MNLDFDNLLLALSAIIIIPLAIFVLSWLKNPFVQTIPLGAPGGAPFKSSRMDGLVRFLKALEFLGVVLLFLSAAGPAVKKTEVVWLNRGADIVFILDVSPSMAALDMDGKSRFAAAKTLIADFSQKRQSDNIGLIAMGNEAALLIPPTTDREALNIRLVQLQVGEFGDGTALGMGLSVAAYHLDKSDARQKIAVLITDGENNAGAIHPDTAASMLRDIDVSLWVIGLGSMGEVPIDYIDPYTKVRRTGIFDSRYDTESLRRLSIVGGGLFIYAPTVDNFVSAFSQLDDDEFTVRRSRVIHRRSSTSLYFLISAIFLLTAVRFIRCNLLRAVI